MKNKAPKKRGSNEARPTSPNTWFPSDFSAGFFHVGGFYPEMINSPGLVGDMTLPRPKNGPGLSDYQRMWTKEKQRYCCYLRNMACHVKVGKEAKT